MTALTSILIPFRDRGTDPLRAANLSAVLDWWEEQGESPMVVSDGRSDKELFNRSAAYNKGIGYEQEADVFIFAESDMLINADQVEEAVKLAQESIGMVVPFTSYCYHSAQNSVAIRAGTKPGFLMPMWRMDNCTSIGAINVVSRATLDAIGGRYDDKFEGNWYDDDAMKIAFEVICGPTRFVQGPADHLYHLPGHRGRHLTLKEKAATHANQRRLGLYEEAARTNNVAEIRRLLRGER